MSHAACQPTDGLHFLRLSQLLFQGLAFTDVLCHDHAHFASAVLQRVRNDIRFENLPVFLAMLPHAVILPRGVPILLMLAQGRVFFRRAYVEDRQCREFFRRITVLTHRGIIDLNKFESLAIEYPRRQRIVGKKQPEGRFALSQCVFRAASLDG